MFDSHAHLQDERLAPHLAQLLTLATSAEVYGICCCATGPADWAKVEHIAAAPLPLVLVPAFGVHPWFVADLPHDWLELLEFYLDQHPVAAIGESGLDGIRRDIPAQLQQEVLHAQLALASRLQRPIILHGARAWGHLPSLLRPYAAKIPAIIIHGFGGSQQIMRQLVDMHCYISFAGTICNPRAEKMRTAAREVPANLLLVESDAPDLFPMGGHPLGVDTRDKPINHPANLRVVIHELARLREVPDEELADLTATNAITALLS